MGGGRNYGIVGKFVTRELADRKKKDGTVDISFAFASYNLKIETDS